MAKKDDKVRRVELVSAELDRELANISARQANAVTRASIVLAASGVTTFAAPASLGWGWSLVPAFLSLVAAALSVAAIHLWRSEAAIMTPDNALFYMEQMTAETLQWRFVRDKLTELRATVGDLNRKNEYLSGAMQLLVCSWVVAVIVILVVNPIIGES